MYIVHKDFSELFMKIIDSALQGSEYGLEAWNILRKYIKSGEDISLDDLGKLEDLIDSALDDIEGPKFRIDLSRDKMYA